MKLWNSIPGGRLLGYSGRGPNGDEQRKLDAEDSIKGDVETSRKGRRWNMQVKTFPWLPFFSIYCRNERPAFGSNSLKYLKSHLRIYLSVEGIHKEQGVMDDPLVEFSLRYHSL
jgi:hypothetical protein